MRKLHGRVLDRLYAMPDEPVETSGEIFADEHVVWPLAWGQVPDSEIVLMDFKDITPEAIDDLRRRDRALAVRGFSQEENDTVRQMFTESEARQPAVPPKGWNPPKPAKPKKPKQWSFQKLTEDQRKFAIQHYPGAGPNDRRFYREQTSQCMYGVSRVESWRLKEAARSLERHLGETVLATCPICPSEDLAEVLMVIYPKPGAVIPAVWSRYPVEIEHDPDAEDHDWGAFSAEIDNEMEA
jgi:hypothetical protein